MTATKVEKDISIKVDTKELQKICNKVLKGVKNNKVLIITSLLKISVVGGVLSFTSTDLTTNVTSKYKNKVSVPDCEIFVMADTFTKLISKVTSEITTLTMCEGNTKLIVKANGTYNFEAFTFAEGEEFPDFSFVTDEPKTEVKLSVLTKVINNNKPSCASDSAQHILTGIYFDQEVMSSDSEKAAATKSNIFNRPVLLRPEAINLISIFEDEDLSVSFNQDRLIIADNQTEIQTAQFEDKEAYPSEGIATFVYGAEFTNSCILDKTLLLNIIDRLSVLADSYEENPLCLIFGDSSLILTNKNNTANEELEYYEDGKGSNGGHFTCGVEAERLKTQVQVVKGNTVELCYGNSTGLKICENNLTLITSLLNQ